jgi:hypothetical protein
MPARGGACASLCSGAAACDAGAQLHHHAIEQATSRDVTGSLQLKLSTSRAAQAQRSLTSKLPWPFGQHDGPASARSLRHCAFSAGQKIGSCGLLF